MRRPTILLVRIFAVTLHNRHRERTVQLQWLANREDEDRHMLDTSTSTRLFLPSIKFTSATSHLSTNVYQSAAKIHQPTADRKLTYTRRVAARHNSPPETTLSTCLATTTRHPDSHTSHPGPPQLVQAQQPSLQPLHGPSYPASRSAKCARPDTICSKSQAQVRAGRRTVLNREPYPA